jgi:hypothetical protein
VDESDWADWRIADFPAGSPTDSGRLFCGSRRVEGCPASRVPYGWAILSDPINRQELLQEGWKDVAKVFVIAIIIDFVYQIIEFRWFYPEEAVIVAAIHGFDAVSAP